MAKVSIIVEIEAPDEMTRTELDTFVQRGMRSANTRSIKFIKSEYYRTATLNEFIARHSTPKPVRKVRMPKMPGKNTRAARPGSNKSEE